MIAQVVPITRLRRDTSSWSYFSPHPVQPGSLVVIPFRGRPSLGVVWSLENDGKATAAIERVICTQPLLRAPHRTLIEWMAHTGLCSLSTALYTWLPAGLREFPLKTAALDLIRTYDRTPPTALALAQAKQHCVLVPGAREHQSAELRRKFGNQFADLFADSADLATWFAVATGEIRIGLGGERALFAPWSNLRHITVIEPEDIAHYHESQPYMSLVDAARVVSAATGAHPTYRSHLPHSVAKELWGDGAFGNDELPSEALFTDLTREPLLNQYLVGKIGDVARNNQTVLILYNAHDALRTLPPEQGSGKKLLPGVETLRKQIARALTLSELPRNIVVGTRSMLSYPYRNVGLTVALNLDHLMENPLFADQLHGWGDVGRLFSYHCPCIIQSHHPEHPFTQSYLRNSLSTHLMERVAQRKENSLPPFGHQVVCSIPDTNDAGREAEALYQQLSHMVHAPWQLSHPFSNTWRKKPFIHLLLHASIESRLPSDVRDTLASLTRPWRVQHNPWHIL